MSTYDLMLSRRTIRKFTNEKIQRDTIEYLIDAARYAPSASNLQPIKYMIITDENLKEFIFDNIYWAKYIAPEGTPKNGEKPTAYILIFIDKKIINTGYEQMNIGLAAQNIMLLAYEKSIGTCLMAAIRRDEICNFLKLDTRQYELNVIISLGYISEFPVVESTNEEIKYYRDNKNILHVPKRKLEDIILNNESTHIN